MTGPISVLSVGDGDLGTDRALSLARLADDVAVGRSVDPLSAVASLASRDVDCAGSHDTGASGAHSDRLSAVRSDHPVLPSVGVVGPDNDHRIGRPRGAEVADWVPTSTDDTVRTLAASDRDAAPPIRCDGGSATTEADAILDAIPDAVIDVDDTETVCAANRAAEAVLTPAADTLVGTELREIVATGDLGEDFLAGYRDAVDALAAGEDTARSTFTVDRGEQRTYEARYAGRSGDRDGAVAVIREVTAHQTRTDRLARYETLLEVMPDPVVITDVEGTILEVHGFEGLSGYRRDELVGASFAKALSAEYQDLAESVARDLWEDDTREKAIYEVEIETNDGERIPFENHFRFLPPIDGGEDPDLLSVLRDVSDRKERERQLNALNETMQALVRAESIEAMADLVVETACDELGFQHAALAIAEEDEPLEYVASATDAETTVDSDSLAVSGFAWEAFEAGERRHREASEADADGQPGRSDVAVSVGEYGVLVLGAGSPEGTAARNISLAEMLAGHVETALDRVFYREELADLAAREHDLELYERAVEATTDGVAILNEEAEFLMVNSRFADSIGQDPEDVEGTTVRAESEDVIVDAPDDLTEQWIQTGEQAREEGRSTFFYESTVDLPEGLRDIENRVTAVRQDDGSLVYVITTRDITERKRRERQIEELHASTRDLMAADSDQQVADEIVEAVESTLGFPANVVRLRSEDGRHLEPAAVTDRARELLGDAYRSSVPVEDDALGEAFTAGEAIVLDDVTEHTDVFDDSDVRSVLCLPIGDYGMVSIVDEDVGVYDESDVRIAEILTANAEAAFGRVEREAALRRRERALSRQIERLDQFASILSHDLRNPLNVAMGHLALLADQVEDEENLETVEGALDRMQEIIDDALTLAREGEEATDLAAVDVDAAARQSWSNVDTGEATLAVETDRTIAADESRLHQLLENLMRNAIDHVGEDVTVRVGDREDGFFLEDDGPGIPDDKREKIFEVGYSTRDEGTGFGLNIVRTIAEAHDWTVDVTSGTDGGARFEITGVQSADESQE